MIEVFNALGLAHIDYFENFLINVIIEGIHTCMHFLVEKKWCDESEKKEPPKTVKPIMIISEKEVLGGREWTMDKKSFIELFHDCNCFSYKGETWSIVQIGSDYVKVKMLET